MAAEIHLTDRSALVAVRTLGADIGSHANRGMGDWLRQDVLPRVKTLNYGFTDRTGRLRKSLRVEQAQGRDVRGRFTAQASGSLTSDIVYAPFVEFGFNRRFSYAGRAFAELEPRLRERIEGRVGAFIRQENAAP